jgi:O-antigen/teichoic acid export membrane protein
LSAEASPPEPPVVVRRRSFVPAVAGTLVSNAGFGVLSLVNVFITSRVLGPRGRGEIAFLTTIAMLTATLSSFGVEEANANLAGREPGSRPSLAANSVVLALVFGGGAALLVAGAMAVFPRIGGDSSVQLRALVLLFIPVLVLQFYLQLLVQADYGFLMTNVASLLGPGLNAGVNGAFALAGILSVGTAVGTWLVGQVLATGLLGWYVARRLGGFGRPDRQLASRAVRFGAKAHLGRAMKTGNYRLDVWLVQAISGSRELGLYSVAVSWTEALFYLPTALSMVLRPDQVRSSGREAGEQTATVFRSTCLLTIPLVVVFIVGAPVLCVTVFGSAFRGSIDDLRYLAPGAFGIIALKLFANALTAQEKPMLGNAALAVAFFTTVLLDVLLIPHLGGAGAAIASSAAYSAGGLAVALIFVRVLGGRRRDLVPGLDDLRRLSPGRLLAIARRRGELAD